MQELGYQIKRHPKLQGCQNELSAEFLSSYLEINQKSERVQKLLFAILLVVVSGPKIEENFLN